MTDEDAECWVGELLARPYARDLFGIELVSAKVGAVVLALQCRRALGHADGWFQGAITTAIGEFAATWSAMTRSSRDRSHATVQQAIQFVDAARGERLIATGRVLAAGRRLSFAAADIHVEESGERRLCAMLTCTVQHGSPPSG